MLCTVYKFESLEVLVASQWTPVSITSDDKTTKYRQELEKKLCEISFYN